MAWSVLTIIKRLLMKETITRKIGLLDVRQALFDDRFQKLFPELEQEIKEFIKKPSCACNRSLYDKLFDYPDRLQQYIPGRQLDSHPKKQAEQNSHNNWKVISCHIDELEGKLRKLPPGRKEYAMARYQDQVTVIINELNIVW